MARIGSLMLALASLLSACTTEEPKRAERPADAAVIDAPAGPTSDSFVVWTRVGMPEGTEDKLRSLAGMKAVTTVTAGLRWIPGSGDAFDIPFEVVYVEPRAWARVMRTDRMYGLKPGNGWLSETGAELRGITEPTYVQHEDGVHHLTPSIDDRSALGFEAVVRGPAPAGWGRDFLLLSYTGPISRLRKAVGGFVDAPFRIHSAAETPFLRHADAVEPLMYLKKRFGEFAAGHSGGTLDIDPAWVEDNIVRRRVPLLGHVTCHRRTLARLVPALNELIDEGSSDAIDPSGFAGCYNPRFIGWDPSSSISAHAFGAALDINAPTNGLGQEPTMDPKIVAIMAKHGFTWGGEWLLPDGMHFEWATRSRLRLFREK